MCNNIYFSVEEAISALSNMCPGIENSAEKPKEVFSKLGHSDTQYESKKSRNRPKRSTMFLLRGLPGSGKSHLAQYVWSNFIENSSLLGTNSFAHQL